MHRIKHEFAVSVRVALDANELRILRDHALSHYDATCRAEAAEDPRGRIEVLRSQMRYCGLNTVEPLLSVDTLQIWTKIMESASDRESVLLYTSLRTALMDALGEQQRLNA